MLRALSFAAIVATAAPASADVLTLFGELHGGGVYGTGTGGDQVIKDSAFFAEAPHLDLVMEPQLSVVLFRRHGWGPDDYQRWSDEALESGLALLVPTVHENETMFRFCFVNPLTTTDDIDLLIEAMR